MQKTKDCTAIFYGHQPETLKSGHKQIIEALRKEIQNAINEGYKYFITGMTRGVDLWSAEQVLELKKTNPQIKLVAFDPYENYAETFKKMDDNLIIKDSAFETIGNFDFTALHKKIKDNADIYHAFKKEKNDITKNQTMIKKASKVIAVYHPFEKTATAYWLAQAKKQGLKINLIQD